MTAASRTRLLEWFDANARELPWRKTSDPYAIWVCESMLQQTQVATVLPYYDRWMARFPTVQDLAVADEQEVLAVWEGLGYYARCRSLLKGAQFIVQNGWPDGLEGWLAVPGVGRYTAGAISSIAYGLRTAVVDGNVTRVVARFTANDALQPMLGQQVWRWAEHQVDGDRPGAWNQALMELGATVCRRSKPSCGECPLADECVANRNGWQAGLPIRGVASPVVTVSNVVWVPFFEGRFGVRQLDEGPWWKGMWEFPRRPVVTDARAAEIELRQIVGPGKVTLLSFGWHRVTKHRIQVTASLVQCDEPSNLLVWRTVEELAELPMPAKQREILDLAARKVAFTVVRPDG